MRLGELSRKSAFLGRYVNLGGKTACGELIRPPTGIDMGSWQPSKPAETYAKSRWPASLAIETNVRGCPGCRRKVFDENGLWPVSWGR